VTTDAFIKGKRVVLRPKRPEDAQGDYIWRIDEELAVLDATTPLRMSFEEYEHFYLGEIRTPMNWARRFAIDTLEGRHIGNCMCYDIDTVKGEAEVGIMIGDRSYWDSGYGSEAFSTLVDYAFRTLSLQRLYLHTLDWNERARQSFSKVGFKERKLVSRKGKKFIFMDVLRSEWEDRHGIGDG
jgi:RimJ/RimL family protein N-acetyltransferase